MGTTSRVARLAGLAAISPTFASVGGFIDERNDLGFTTWLSACRASGLSFSSLTHFTLELLPTAVVGALLGALVVLVLAFEGRNRPGNLETCLAAHAGCAIAMPVGLILCALALPVPAMLIAEVALAVAAAHFMSAMGQRYYPSRVSPHP
jgi:hypothetical protein